jgi:hypothetical protein
MTKLNDFLALAILKKPQNKSEILSQGKAATVLGVEFWANEPEVRQLQHTVQERESVLVRKTEEVTRLGAEKEE